MHRLWFKPPARKAKPAAKLTTGKLLMRLGVGFVFVFTIVMLAGLDPTLAAILAVFPALGTANQLLVWHSSGPQVVAALSASMCMGGTGVYTYALAFGMTVEHYGAWGAAGISLLVSLCIITIPMFLVLRKKPPPIVLPNPSIPNLSTDSLLHTKPSQAELHVCSEPESVRLAVVMEQDDAQNPVADP